MNILSVFVLFAIILKCVAASEDALRVEFRKAFEWKDFGWLNRNWEGWKKRGDLLDDVIAEGVDFTITFIQKVKDAKLHVLAVLFDTGKTMVDEVLRGIEHFDEDLPLLTNYQRELAGSPERFFRVLDKITEPRNQETAVELGVKNLFKAGRHDLVVPLVNALEKETFRSNRLNDVAISTAFEEGTERDNQDIVKEYCEHLAITPEKYAIGLMRSWNFYKPEVFQILLEQADQGDLNKVKEKYAEKMYERLHLAIDKAPEPVPRAGSRHSRFLERAALEVRVPTTEASIEDGPSSSIKESIFGEKEKTKENERMEMEKSQEASQEREQEQLETVQVQEGGEAQVQGRQGGKKKARRGLKRRQQHKRKSERRSHQRRR